ncbi:hypothetical protein C8Q72DRAFT_883216 [Fomitopsis betulina]|nr:hypothetical protein C8Q72DRAFT_883216 [Fomitopsis betulina]
MDCSQFFPSSSPSRSTRPVADARSSSPSGKTDSASEDGQSHKALNNSFQDSGYGDSVEASGPPLVATPSSVSIGRDPVVNLVFTQLFGSRFPHKVDVFSNWFEDELFPWVTGTTGREPSNRIVHLPRGAWADIQQYIDRIGGRSFCFVLRFLYNSKLETLIMSVTKKTHAVVPGAVFDIVKRIAIPEQHLPYTSLSYDSSAVAPYAVVGEEKSKIIKQVPDCKVTSVLRAELQSMGNQELTMVRTRTRGRGEDEGEEDADNEVVGYRSDFTGELYNLETADSETFVHALRKLAIGSTTETVRSSLVRRSSFISDTLSDLTELSSDDAQSPTPATEQASSSMSVAPAVPAPSVPTPAVSTPAAIAIKAVEDPTLQKDRPLRRSTKHVGEEDEILACLPVIIVNIDKVNSGQAQRQLQPEAEDSDGASAEGSIFVFPDEEGLEMLRLGAKEGWSEDFFIDNGYGMHVVPLLRHKMRKDKLLRREMAVATVYGKESEQVQQYLTTYHPELRKLLKELPDPSGQGDAGLELLVDLLSSKLRAASKSMVEEQVQSVFSSRNTLPKVVAAAFSHKRSRSSVDTSDWEAEFDELMGTISKLHGEVQSGTFTKKPRYSKHSRPKFRFSESQIWGEDPSKCSCMSNRRSTTRKRIREISKRREMLPTLTTSARTPTESMSGEWSSKKGKGKRA